MKKKLLTSAIALAVAAPAQSAVLLGNYGASTTLGQVATSTTVNSVRYNPAAGYLALDHKNDENVRFGYLSQLGASVEFGDAENFVDETDRLIDSLDSFDEKLTNTQNFIENPSRYNPSAPSFIDSGNPLDEPAAVANALSDAQVVVDDLNNVLRSFDENGRVKTQFSAAVPGMPVVFELPKVPGVLSLDASLGFISLAGLDYKESTVTTGVSDISDVELNTDSQIDIRGGTVAQFGLGYSQAVDAIRNIGPLEGELVLGAKANMYVASLVTSKAKIYRTDDKEVADLIEDAVDESEDSTAFGLDLGAVWHAENYHLGLTVKNVNSPEFDAYQHDEVKDGTAKGQTVTVAMDPQTTFDTAVFMKDRALMLAASADLNKIDDLVGDEVQMMHVSAAYYPSNFAIPTVRVGYEKNLAGEELSAVNLGLGLFRGMANFDVTYGLETTTVDGDEMPRRLGLQLSFEETF